MTDIYNDLEVLEIIEQGKKIKFRNKLFISWTVFIMITIIVFLMSNFLDGVVPNILIIGFILNLFYLTIILPVKSNKLLYKILFFIVNYIIGYGFIILIFIICLALGIIKFRLGF